MAPWRKGDPVRLRITPLRWDDEGHEYPEENKPVTVIIEETDHPEHGNLLVYPDGCESWAHDHELEEMTSAITSWHKDENGTITANANVALRWDPKRIYMWEGVGSAEVPGVGKVSVGHTTTGQPVVLLPGRDEGGGGFVVLEIESLIHAALELREQKMQQQEANEP